MGDMIMTRRQHKWLFSNDTIKRHGLSNNALRWPGGIIPLVISPQLSSEVQGHIKDAATYIAKGTCVKFLLGVDPRSHPVHVNIVRSSSGRCNAQLGYNKVSTTINIDPTNCGKGEILHEMLHVVGLLHMHQAANRDDFIEIDFNNIEPARKDQFAKMTRDGSMFNTAYDYSVKFFL